MFCWEPTPWGVFIYLISRTDQLLNFSNLSKKWWVLAAKSRFNDFSRKVSTHPYRLWLKNSPPFSIMLSSYWQILSVHKAIVLFIWLIHYFFDHLSIHIHIHVHPFHFKKCSKALYHSYFCTDFTVTSSILICFLSFVFWVYGDLVFGVLITDVWASSNAKLAVG